MRSPFSLTGPVGKDRGAATVETWRRTGPSERAGSIKAAQRANEIVSSIYFKGEEPQADHSSHHGGFPCGGEKILERISVETGGRMFEVTKKQDLASIYTEIGEELRSQYRLGYTPDEAAAADGDHQVDLTVPKQNRLQVQTRDGYSTGK